MASASVYIGPDPVYCDPFQATKAPGFDSDGCDVVGDGASHIDWIPSYRQEIGMDYRHYK